jgi:hypothetical protein
MMPDRRRADRRITPPHLATPPLALPERRQGPRRALDRLQTDLVQRLAIVAKGPSGMPRGVLFEQVLSQFGSSRRTSELTGQKAGGGLS